MLISYLSDPKWFFRCAGALWLMQTRGTCESLPSWTVRCRNCNGLNDLCWAQYVQTLAPCLSLEPQVGEQRIIPSDDLKCCSLTLALPKMLGPLSALLLICFL